MPDFQVVIISVFHGISYSTREGSSHC